MEASAEAGRPVRRLSCVPGESLIGIWTRGLALAVLRSDQIVDVEVEPVRFAGILDI